MTNIIPPKNNNTPQLATLAGGCFWCIESAFSQLQGIISATSGYMGGHLVNPSYEAVCTGITGHAEVVQLRFDENLISFQEILEVFFTLHDPTQLNRQGNDIGSQYRSAIFYHTAAQQQTIEKVITQMVEQKMYGAEIVTQVSAAEKFYLGESYHQNYFKNNPENQYCQAVVSPKLAKFRQTFISKLKP